MSHEMELEDYYHQAKAEVGALREQLDNMVVIIRERDREIAELRAEVANNKERLSRTTLALDDALGILRAQRAEAEVLEL